MQGDLMPSDGIRVCPSLKENFHTSNMTLQTGNMQSSAKLVFIFLQICTVFNQYFQAWDMSI